RRSLAVPPPLPPRPHVPRDGLAAPGAAPDPGPDRGAVAPAGALWPADRVVAGTRARAANRPGDELRLGPAPRASDLRRPRGPPPCAGPAALAPARPRALGLPARRAATLVRLCRELDLERLHTASTDSAAGRLLRERGIGPWSVGVVCLEGLGRAERGLV